MVGQQGNYGQANCATTTSGLFGFTRTLTPEFASEGLTVEWSDSGGARTLRGVPREAGP